MATAIDFQALFAEERARMLVELGEVGTGTAPAVDEPASRGPASPRWEQLPWEALPDPPVALAPKTPLNIEANALCRTALAGVHYVPNFVTPDEAAALLARLEEMPESCWAQLRRRRLQNHGGTPHANGMHPEPIPRFVQALMDATVEAGVFPRDAPPNHVLLNEYARGQGIAPHQDGPLYAPQVAILSLDGPALLQFWPSLEATREADGAAGSVLCMPNSLLVFNSDAYETHWHGIREVVADTVADHTGNAPALGLAPGVVVPRGPRRISLTVRRVLKVRRAEERIVTEEARAERRRREKWWLASRGEEGVAEMSS